MNSVACRLPPVNSLRLWKPNGRKNVTQSTPPNLRCLCVMPLGSRSLGRRVKVVMRQQAGASWRTWRVKQKSTSEGRNPEFENLLKLRHLTSSSRSKSLGHDRIRIHWPDRQTSSGGVQLEKLLEERSLTQVYPPERPDECRR